MRLGLLKYLLCFFALLCSFSFGQIPESLKFDDGIVDSGSIGRYHEHSTSELQALRTIKTPAGEIVLKFGIERDLACDRSKNYWENFFNATRKVHIAFNSSVNTTASPREPETPFSSAEYKKFFNRLANSFANVGYINAKVSIHEVPGGSERDF